MIANPTLPREAFSGSEKRYANAAMKKSIIDCFFQQGQLMIPEIARLTRLIERFRYKATKAKMQGSR